MEVTVHVRGALRAAAGGRDVAVSLPDEATAGDLLASLAERLGAPFASAAAAGDSRLPPEIRLFVGADLVASREQPLAARAATAPVTVVVLTPLSGG